MRGCGLISFLILFGLNFSSIRCGDQCLIPPFNTPGECVHVSQCPAPTSGGLKSSQHRGLVICNRELQLICCPTRAQSQSLREVADSTSESPFARVCTSFKSRMKKNETVMAFVFGEPSVRRVAAFCNTNQNDNGIAYEKEFPHVAYIEGRALGRRQTIDTKCVGSLITQQFVLTSALCIDKDRHESALIRFGMLNLRSVSTLERAVERLHMYTNRDLTLLKLPLKVELNEFAVPACLPADDLSAEGQFILSGWTGYEFECSPHLKKWLIQPASVQAMRGGHIYINATSIINYYETLLSGSPLHVYHPQNPCQYIVSSIFKRIMSGKYEFISLSASDVQRWMESVVWPMKLPHASGKIFEIIDEYAPRDEN